MMNMRYFILKRKVKMKTKIRKCPICEKSFLQERHAQKYCSEECANKAIKGNVVLYLTRQVKEIQKKDKIYFCKICKKQFEKTHTAQLICKNKKCKLQANHARSKRYKDKIKSFQK